jgi:hypothetical protein
MLQLFMLPENLIIDLNLFNDKVISNTLFSFMNN